MEKICTKCSTPKPLSAFYVAKKKRPDGSTYDYVLPSCKKCFADYYIENRAHQVQVNLEARARRRYGISRAEYEALIAGPCTTCGRSDVRRVVDHCHKTGDGHVRGVLCDGCNMALGGARDDPKVLRALADYLEAV